MSSQSNNREFAVGLLHALADSLYMRLVLFCKGPLMSVKGTQDIEIPVTEEVLITGTLKVLASGIGLGKKEYAWILVHVKGNLWLHATYDYSTRMVQFSLIDGFKVGLNPTSAPLFEQMTKEARKSNLSNGVVAEFSRCSDQSKWKRHGKTDCLDEGQPLPVEGDGGDDHPTAPVPAPSS